MAILQSLLKSYRPVVVEKTKAPADPTTRRREKFVTALKEQLALLDNPKLTRKKRNKEVAVRSWVVSTADGACFIPKWGVRPLALSPGKPGLLLGQVADPPAVRDLIGKLVQATEAGELDTLLAQAVAARKTKKAAKSKKAA